VNEQPQDARRYLWVNGHLIPARDVPALLDQVADMAADLRGLDPRVDELAKLPRLTAARES
jgi:hypothetical protein